MTINVSQNSFRAPLDLLTKTEIYFDNTINDNIGLTEFEIKSIEDVVNVCRVVEKERTTRATDMNAESSRVHCIMNIKLYQLRLRSSYIDSNSESAMLIRWSRLTQ